MLPRVVFPELPAAERAALPYTKISKPKVDCRFEGLKYFVGTEERSFDGSGGSSKLWILPEGNGRVLNLAVRE
jgi:hypothetical protein